LGDSVNVRVARVDLDEKKIDFELTKKLDVTKKPKKRRRKK
jgi:ribonuclease R